VARDDAAALAQFRLAARKGNAFAMDNLGWMAEEGRGQPADPAEALRWYRLAEARGNAPARNHLALLYARGKGVARDDVAALGGFRAASAQGLAAAWHNLGYMVANGLGGEPRADLAVGIALQSLARETTPPSAEELPTLDAAPLSPAERARSDQMLAAFRSNPSLLSVLDSAIGPPGVTSLSPVSSLSNTSGNGIEGHAIAPPSATQR